MHNSNNTIQFTTKGSMTSGVDGDAPTEHTVYVTQDSGRINLLPAARWGRIEVLCSQDMPTQHSTAEFTARLTRKLKDFNPDKDFVVLVGDPVVIFTVGLILREISQRYGGFVRVLKWDRQELCYQPVEVQL